jgi:hypothetical protein
VGHRTGMDDVERRKLLPLLGLELRPLGSPARSQLLYRLRCPDSILILSTINIQHRPAADVSHSISVPEYWYRSKS